MTELTKLEDSLFDETLLFSSDQLERLTGPSIRGRRRLRCHATLAGSSDSDLDRFRRPMPDGNGDGVLGQTGDAVGMCLMRMQGTFTGRWFSLSRIPAGWR